MHMQQQHANMTNGSSRSTVSSFANDYPTYKLDRNTVVDTSMKFERCSPGPLAIAGGGQSQFMQQRPPELPPPNGTGGGGGRRNHVAMGAVAAAAAKSQFSNNAFGGSRSRLYMGQQQ